MSASDVFCKSVYATGRGIKHAWNTAIGNTLLEKRGLKTLGFEEQMGATGIGVMLGAVNAGAAHNPAWLLLALSGVAFLNLGSAYRAGKYDIQREKAEKATLEEAQKEEVRKAARRVAQRKPAL